VRTASTKQRGTFIRCTGLPYAGTMLQIRGLHKRFGEKVALNGFDLDAQPGRLVGFLGANGAGKTTTMRAIFGLLEVDAGTLEWRGRPIEASSRDRFGYMPEQRGLYGRMPIAEQLAYFGTLHGLAKRDANKSASAMLEELGLADRANDRLESLSHGNQQRIQLGVALVHRPELLVLDEPFSGLDPIGIATMTDVLRARANEGAAVLFSSHQLDLVENFCDDVVVIDNGRQLDSGSLLEVQGRSGYLVAEVEFADASLEPGNVEGCAPERDRGGWRYRLPHSIATTEVVTQLAKYGNIRSFSHRPPALAEVFRSIVRKGGGVS
jgi:ABC-2 type transport system ATP-binding protein